MPTHTNPINKIQLKKSYWIHTNTNTNIFVVLTLFGDAYKSCQLFFCRLFWLHKRWNSIPLQHYFLALYYILIWFDKIQLTFLHINGNYVQILLPFSLRYSWSYAIFHFFHVTFHVLPSCVFCGFCSWRQQPGQFLSLAKLDDKMSKKTELCG